MTVLSGQQQQIVKTLLKQAQARNAGPKITKALVEAGIAESGLTNPHGGDRDSQGVLQQRPSQGWGTPAQVTDPVYAANKFIDAAKPLRGAFGNAGELAQAVQRSGFPARYGQAGREAASLIAQFGGGQLAASAPVTSRAAPAAGGSSTAGGSSARTEAVLNWLYSDSKDPADLTEALAAVPATAVPKAPAAAPPSGSQVSPSKVGLAKVDGKPVAAWIAPILQWAKQQGWTGTVQSGYRSDAEQTAIYDSGVRPAALPQSLGGKGSNHEFQAFPGGAVDVSNAAQLSRILQRNPRYARLLQWAGGKDPVHFSHPTGGHY